MNKIAAFCRENASLADATENVKSAKQNRTPEEKAELAALQTAFESAARLVAAAIRVQGRDRAQHTVAVWLAYTSPHRAAFLTAWGV